MKLVNSLVVAFLGTILAAGCTVTDDTSSDGGTSDGAVTDTGIKADTTPSGDTTPAGDTATGDTGDAGEDCGTCATRSCSTEITACTGEASCKSGLDCFNACTSKDCKNACISNSKNPDGTAGNDKLATVVGCAITNCKTACGLD